MENHVFKSQAIDAAVRSGAIGPVKVNAYLGLVQRISKELLPHEVIVNNEYTRWFRQGSATHDDVRHFLQQFSVFSNLFLEAQLKKVINAPTLEAMHDSKEILLNELGVVFRSREPKAQAKAQTKASTESTSPEDLDALLVQQEGTIEGGHFRFAAAHFEWLLRMTSHLGLSFSEVGKRKHGTSSTLFFCDELARLYGSEDPHTALGASFAVENWAAAGFWKELIAGLEAFKKAECPGLPLAFFVWHDRVEDQHAALTWHELEEEFFAMDLDEDRFMQGGRKMLDGVLAFWKGLDADRRRSSGAARFRET